MEAVMTFLSFMESPPRRTEISRTNVRAASEGSYDSGYEHSVEHWAELQRLIEAADPRRPAHQLPLLMIYPRLTATAAAQNKA